MMTQVEEAAAAGASHVEFMLHSSELMPAGSPTFPDARSVERLYADLEMLFERASAVFSGATLAEFRHVFEPARVSPFSPKRSRREATWLLMVSS